MSSTLTHRGKDSTSQSSVSPSPSPYSPSDSEYFSDDNSSSANSPNGFSGGVKAVTTTVTKNDITITRRMSDGTVITKQTKRRFKLIRSLAMADFITLGNAGSGISSIFLCLNFLENARYEPYLLGAFILLPIALICDILDGSVARWRKKSSPYGKDLDSLADVVSFSVAPAVLGFTLGLRGIWDCLVLCYFVCCGIGRLARYNVTSTQLMFGSNKVKYYEGFPVPMSLVIVLILGVAYYCGAVFDNIWLGSYKNLHPYIPGTFHPFVLIYFFFGCAHISEWKIPKP
jgi:CDP-diacylglycerol--serine O-phosphatidyltransferase